MPAVNFLLKFSCLLPLCVLLAACYARVEIPMHNLQTGEDLVCHSDKYYFEQGGRQEVIAIACAHACERYGFRQFTGNPVIDTPQPMLPRDYPENGVTKEDIISELPERCLP